MGDISRGYAYVYDRAGNQTKKTETGNGNDKVTEYAYDSLNRLSEVTEDDGTRIEYSFDAWGNIAEKTYHHPSDYAFELGETEISDVSEHTVSYVYDEANRLLSETESVTGSADFSGTRTYAYDDAGNLTSKITSGDYGAKSESYVYDGFGKLIKYVENGEEKASYKYNGSGQRVEKTVNGVKTKFYWDGANVKNEGTASSVNVTNYFGANGVFARKSGSEADTLYKNGHGDTVLLTRGNAIVRDYDYDAYGAEKNALSSDDNPFRYSGEYTDEETGFIYLRNRMYDPETGRFTTEAPAKSGVNWYAYCEGNPINFIDTWGLKPSVMEAALMAEHVYNHNYDERIDNRRVYDTDGNYTGWRLIDMYTYGTSKIGVYVRGDGKDNLSTYEGPMEYVLSYKGTSPTSAEDWENNVKQFIGEYSEHLFKGIGYTAWFVENKKDYEITFTGHSKGGEAAVNAEL